MSGPTRFDPALRGRRLREASALLPVAGLLLLIAPLASVFALPHRIGGVPLVVLYVFLVWGGLILAARAIGRRLDPPGGGGG